MTCFCNHESLCFVVIFPHILHVSMAPREMYWCVYFPGDSTHKSIAGNAEAMLKAFLFKDFIKTNDDKK